MQPENTEQVNIPVTDAPGESLPVRSKGSACPLFGYWAAFFLAIAFWEIFMGRLSQDSFASINYWFLLFAVPQALVFAALCGWGKARFDRVLFFLLLFVLFSFYTAQFIFFRAFDSMISLSMIGMGGDAMDDFGWAMMVTIRESWLLLLLLSLPVLLALARIFVKKPSAGKLRPVWRPVALAAAVLLWLAAGQALRLGGTSESSAWRAYVSSLVDADTSARRIGVLTTTVMDLRSSLAEEEYDKEISDTVGSAAASDSIEIPAGVQTAVLPTVPPVQEEAEPAETPEEPAEPEADPVDRSPNIFEEIDFSYLASITDKDSLKSLCEYLATVPGTNKNEYTGYLEGYNVILVCAESFCTYAMSEQVTPTLWKMANEASF
jgi:lipoteichoic acid synthase